MCEINYSAAIAAPGTARSFRFQHRNHEGSPCNICTEAPRPPARCYTGLQRGLGEPLAWRAVPHLRKELSAASQIRIASARAATSAPGPRLLLRSLPAWMPELPPKLVSHAIRLSSHCHICIGTGLSEDLSRVKSLRALQFGLRRVVD